MDKQRELFIQEINRLESAIGTTRSPYLKRDYSKAIKTMRKELRDYDRFKKKTEPK